MEQTINGKIVITVTETPQFVISKKQPSPLFAKHTRPSDAPF